MKPIFSHFRSKIDKILHILELDFVTKAKRLKELQDQLAVNVQAILVKRGWSQSDLAQRLKKNKSHISQILNSKVNLTLRLIVEIEDALGEKIISASDKGELK